MSDASGPEQPGGRSHPVVLVADDAAATRASLRDAVTGFDAAAGVIEAETGRQALNALVNHRPDMVFINVKLPDINGAEALAWAKVHRIRTLPVLMSNLVVPKWVELSTELEAYEFLKKPFDPDHVVHLMRAHRRMLDRTRILIVEASQAARHLIRRTLGHSRFSLAVDETDDGRHAVKLMRQETYDIALVDFNLAGMDGLEVVCQAREAAPNTRFVLMSGMDNEKFAQAARHFGVGVFLKKPFYPRDVDYALHTAFGLRRPYLLSAQRAAAPMPAPAAPIPAASAPSCGF